MFAYDYGDAYGVVIMQLFNIVLWLFIMLSFKIVFGCDDEDRWIVVVKISCCEYVKHIEPSPRAVNGKKCKIRPYIY